MANRVFVDTNILLRSTIKTMDEYPAAKQLIRDQRRAGYDLWISRQVIREFISVVTRPQTWLTTPLDMADVVGFCDVFERIYFVADDTAAVTHQLYRLIKAYPTGGNQIHDANIVATMRVNHIDTVLTLNTKDFERFEPEITLITLTS